MFFILVPMLKDHSGNMNKNFDSVVYMSLNHITACVECSLPQTTSLYGNSDALELL